MPEEREIRRRRVTAPARAMLAWLAAIIVGAVALGLPISATDEPLSWIDALFTSTSALCVTGLSTVTVNERLSDFGQAVLLLLIQLGGLGITTLSTFLLVAAGRATLSQYFAVKETLASVRVNPLRLLSWVLITTVVVESVGAVMLKRFFGEPASWWTAVFHSVSAFCNAGFSLFPDNLSRYRADLGVNATVTFLIMIGGLGFIALHQLFTWGRLVVRRRRVRLFLHTRTVLIASVALWGLGLLVFLALEWNGTMAGMTNGGKILAAWFQSVTPRTAGYNTLDFSMMREATLFFTMFLMFIGAAPGGCAGGVKVTTAVVILAAVRAHARGAETVTFSRRTLPPWVVRRSYMLVTLSLVFLALIVAGLLLTEEHSPANGVRSDRFILLSFEAVSAFGTVGLSAGVTAGLSTGGKLLIILCMFVGRLGPLLVVLAVIRPGHAPLFEFPEEELAIG